MPVLPRSVLIHLVYDGTCVVTTLASCTTSSRDINPRIRRRSQRSPEPVVKEKETSTELSSSKPLDPQFRVKMSSQRSQPHHTQQAYQVCGYGSYRCTEPIDPTRIGIDRLSRKEISQSRTMPRSSRVWRESVLCGIATDVAPRAGFRSGSVSLIPHSGHLHFVQVEMTGTT